MHTMHYFFPQLRHSCWAQTLLVTWHIRHYNRETVSVITFLRCVHDHVPYLKSLSPISFVNIRLREFWCNEFLIKMYRLLQNYIFEICTLSRQWIFVVYTIFFPGRSLFTSDRKVNTWFCTHVHWFATIVLTRFLFSS